MKSLPIICLICAICAICGQINAAEYIIAYKGQVPAWAPADIEAYSYDDWHSLTPELKGYNPPQYPAVILRNTRIMSIQPDSWTNALADITAQQQTARDANLTEAQITDRNTCHQQLGGILYTYGIALPVKPMDAFSQMRAIATTNELARVEMTYALALYTRLRDEYGMTDAQIGGLE